MLRSNAPPRIGTAPGITSRFQSAQNGRDWKANRPKVVVTPDPSAALALHGEDHDPNLAETTSKRLGGPPKVAVTKPPPKPRQPFPKKKKLAPSRPTGLPWSRNEEQTRQSGYGGEHLKDSRDAPRYREDERRWNSEVREREYRQNAWSHYRDRTTPRQEPDRGGSSWTESRYSFNSRPYLHGAGVASFMATQELYCPPEPMHPRPSFSPSTDSPSTPEDLPALVEIMNHATHRAVSSPLALTPLGEDVTTSGTHEETSQYHSTAPPSPLDSNTNSFKVEEGSITLDLARSALESTMEGESLGPGSSTLSLKRKFSQTPSPSQFDMFKRRQMSETHVATTAGSSLARLPAVTITQESTESQRASPMLLDVEPPIVVKREPSPDRLPSPIDVDAPPLSLYEQLGLPERTSGSHRVPRPKYSMLQTMERKAWAEERSNAIRWVRGTAYPPLEMGSIFWRADGVCFDWSVSEEELLGAAHREASTSTQHIQREPSATPEESTHQAQQLDRSEDVGSNQALAGAVVLSRVGLASFSAEILSGIAICFLDRYTRCFDHVASRNELLKAYSADAIMTLQFNDLPSEGVCPRVGKPSRQGHSIVDLTEREHGRNLLLSSDREPTHPSYHYRARKCFNSGPQAIISKLLEFDDLTHSPTIDSTSFQFDITAFADLGCVLLKFYGELYNRHTVERPSSVALRFDRSFLLRQNDVNSPSWIDWPWIITNDQMTLFHRPGIICQCNH